MAHPIALRRLLLSALLFAACADPNARDPRYDGNKVYRGWVTDAATGKPIEGAVVVAAWQILQRHYFIVEANPDIEVVRLAEVLTDKDGRFEFAPLGDYNLPLGWHKEEGRFPQLAFFKPGYEPARRDEISWDQDRDHLSQPFNNPATASPQKPTGEREVQLFRYLTRPERKSGVIDPSVKSGGTEQQIYGRLDGFAFTLAMNVRNSDDRGAPDDSQRRRRAIEAQWRAILMIDEEIRKYRPNYQWSGAIVDALRDKVKK
ncbi:MAG TPA: carboxypeptidase-like regulatory domain-containing protein [Bradyrhizobium sp.]|nr:carboxypeptidase-like regulatory domain-containing protein [Bradyrhizobium sp.]